MLSTAACWAFLRYDKQLQAVCIQLGIISTCQGIAVIGIAMIAWFLTMTYRSASWLRACNDAIAVAFHPFWWVAIMLLPFVKFLVIGIILWRMMDLVSEDLADPAAGRPEEPGGEPGA